MCYVVVVVGWQIKVEIEKKSETTDFYFSDSNCRITIFVRLFDHKMKWRRFNIDHKEWEWNNWSVNDWKNVTIVHIYEYTKVQNNLWKGFAICTIAWIQMSKYFHLYYYTNIYIGKCERVRRGHMSPTCRLWMIVQHWLVNDGNGCCPCYGSTHFRYDDDDDVDVDGDCDVAYNCYYSPFVVHSLHDYYCHYCWHW